MTEAATYRRMVNRINRVIVGLQRLGIAFGPMYLLTVAGRHSGQPRTSPLAVVDHAGDRYLVQAYPRAAWVANVRAAGTGVLTRRRRTTTVRLTELEVEERVPLLKDVIGRSPRSVATRFVTTGLADAPTADAVAAAAPRIAVFRIEPD